jgi:hypothetical protein
MRGVQRRTRFKDKGVDAFILQQAVRALLGSVDADNFPEDRTKSSPKGRTLIKREDLRSP